VVRITAANIVFSIPGVSSGVCGQVDSMINSAFQFPRRSIYYNPVWGPNSNTAAKYFGNAAGFQPNFPFNAYGSGARFWRHDAVTITLGFTSTVRQNIRCCIGDCLSRAVDWLEEIVNSNTTIMGSSRIDSPSILRLFIKNCAIEKDRNLPCP
jgi:hypothetical protein